MKCTHVTLACFTDLQWTQCIRNRVSDPRITGNSVDWPHLKPETKVRMSTDETSGLADTKNQAGINLVSPFSSLRVRLGAFNYISVTKIVADSREVQHLILGVACPMCQLSGPPHTFTPRLETHLGSTHL